MALANVVHEGCILIRGDDVDGRSVAFGLLRPQESVRVVCMKGMQSILKNKFKSKIHENVYFTSIDRNSSLNVLNDLRSCKNDLCIITAIDYLCLLFGPRQMARFVHGLKRSMCVMMVVEKQSLPEEDFSLLQSVSDSIFDLTHNGSTVVSQAQVYKRNGKMLEMTEEVTLDESLKVSSKKKEQNKAEISAAEPTLDINAPFDIGLTLKDTEQSAKDSLVLPYMDDSTQQGLVRLRESDKKVRVGGQVIYTPDDGDDLDDSDPDDDLHL